MKVDLHTTDDGFETLHEIAGSRKATVRVDRQALLHLLMDHTSMVNALQLSGCKIHTPRERVRLKG